ncbi:MAG TPA: ATP-binding protein, partial [Anaerolineales bacterium]|nr:ATP-binding protein [Anaerolineales bacterium]
MAKRILKVGNIRGVEGEVNIAGGDIYKGYTVEQVTHLLAEITTKYRRKPFTGRCPYKGLEVFEEEDAELFFGRERLVSDLIGRVKESRTVFITGPSGSGKSSLVRAGLLHALKQGAIKSIHSESWLYETMKPGREPLKELALVFSRLKSPELANYFRAHAGEAGILHECAESILSGRKGQRFVLFVDQFEEVFTQVNQEEERVAFLSMLAHAGTVENGRVIVLFAMRSDFVSNCAAYPALNELLSQQFRQIGAMQPEELVSAIALPARQVGLPVEDELIARIINDMKGEPGALPLMQFALKDLFDSQQDQGGVIALTLEEYLQHGGIQKSLEHHADDSFARLNAEEQTLARSIFSGLIEIGRGASDTRR